MYSNVFSKTLRDGRRSMLLVGLLQFVVGMYVALLYPDVGSGFAEMIEDLPDFFQAFVGSAEEFATPEGFFSTEPYAVVTPIIMIAFAINRGMGAVAGEEQGDTLDQLLGNPVSRTSLLVQKSFALTLECVIPTVLVGVAIALGASIMDYSVSTSGLVQISLSVLLLSYALGFLALGVGAAMGNKNLAMAVPAVVAVVGYLVNILAPVVDGMSFTRYISVMHYYIGDKPLIHGITPWHALVLITIAAVSFAVGLYRFNNRDLR